MIHVFNEISNILPGFFPDPLAAITNVGRGDIPAAIFKLAVIDDAVP